MPELDGGAERVLKLMAAKADAVSQAATPRSDAEWVAQYRGQILDMRTLAGPVEAVLEVSRHSFEGPDGPLALTAFRPAPGILPAIVYFHGGGFVAGCVDSHDPALRALANVTGALVIAAEYRRAPEYRFPAAPEDCHAAAVHVAKNASAFGVDPARIAVAGDSAGGGLAAVVAAMARDRGGPALAGQISLYPNTDLRPGRAYPSLAEHDGRVVKLDELGRSIRLYLDGADPAHPHASPLFAAADGLAPALVVTCGFDPLQDEGIAYVEHLRRAGRDVTHLHLPDMIHGVLVMAGEIPAARTLMTAIRDWLDGLAKPARP